MFITLFFAMFITLFFAMFITLFTVGSLTDTNIIILSHNNKVPNLAILGRVPGVTSIHLHITKHRWHCVLHLELCFVIHLHFIDELILNQSLRNSYSDPSLQGGYLLRVNPHI